MPGYARGTPMSKNLQLSSSDGTPLAAAYWAAAPGSPGVVIVHGLDSRKENHADFAEVCAAAGLAAIAVDLRGHGASGGTLDAGAIDDVVAAGAALTARGHATLGLRGSSLGGLLALLAAPRMPGAACVVAICPAQADALAARIGNPWPRDLRIADALSTPDGIARGYWHATGDERVPWASTAVLAAGTPHPRRARFILGGHHGSLQHDPGIQAETCAFLRAHMRAAG
jgi:alpha-beta hydrolase superfamily lysophospholipase